MMALKFYRKRSLYFTIHVMHIKNNLQYKVLTITLSLYLHYTSCNMIIIVHGLRLNSRIDHDDFHSDGLIAMNLKDKLLQYSIEKRHSALATLWAYGNYDHDLQFVTYSKRSKLGRSGLCEYKCQGNHDRDQTRTEHLKQIPIAVFK